MKKIVFTFASLFMITGFMFTQTKAEANDKLQLYTVDTELEAFSQKHIKGTQAQLSNVDQDSMRFIKNIAFDAYKSGSEYGIYPSIIIAQAVLESDSGKSGLSKAPNNNLFGVKGSYNGQSVKLLTKEDDGTGKLYTIYANFKKYPNREASLRDHGRLLREGLNGFYSGAWRENAETPEQAAKYLEGRYATDTSYSSKLINIINDYNLKRFDETLTDRDFLWLESDSLDPWELPVIDNPKVDVMQTWYPNLNNIAKIITDMGISTKIENYILLNSESTNFNDNSKIGNNSNVMTKK